MVPTSRLQRSLPCHGLAPKEGAGAAGAIQAQTLSLSSWEVDVPWDGWSTSARGTTARPVESEPEGKGHNYVCQTWPQVFHTRVNSSPTSMGAVKEADREMESGRRRVHGSKGERDRQWVSMRPQNKRGDQGVHINADKTEKYNNHQEKVHKMSSPKPLSFCFGFLFVCLFWGFFVKLFYCNRHGAGNELLICKTGGRKSAPSPQRISRRRVGSVHPAPFFSSWIAWDQLWRV